MSKRLKIHLCANVCYLQCFAGCSLLTIARAFVRALKTRCLPYCHFGRDGSSWLDHAMEKQGGHHSELQEEETRNISALLPLFSLQILYRTCLLQVRMTANTHQQRHGNFVYFRFVVVVFLTGIKYQTKAT